LGVGTDGHPTSPGQFNRDPDNVTRPQGLAWDRGAFEFAELPEPSAPTNRSPVNGATGVSLTPTLSWTAGANSTSTDVYFGTFSGVGSAAFSDAFSGTLSGWDQTFSIAESPWSIVSAMLRPTTAGTDALIEATQTLEPNQWYQYTLGTGFNESVTPNRAVAVLRGDGDTWLGYYAGPYNNGTGYTTRIARSSADGNTFDTLNSNSTSWAAGDVVLVTIVGHDIIVYKNGAAVLTASDNSGSYIVGSISRAGFYGFATTTAANATVDTVSMGNMGPLYVQNQAGTTYAPSTSSNTTYYWKLAGRNSTTFTDSTIISFTTVGSVPSCPTNFSPTNGATGVSANPTLSWTASANTTGYDVYFDTGSATTLVSSNQAGVTYASTTSASTTYSWKVVSKNAAGDAVGCTAATFTTQSAAAGTGGNRFRRKSISFPFSILGGKKRPPRPPKPTCQIQCPPA